MRRAKASIIFWGMGISQHIHGTDNARCLISLALLTGQIGRPGTGLHPLRGQNNVQGASDVGLIPMVYPDYQPVKSRKARQYFEQLWGTRLDPYPGLTVVEIMSAVHHGEIKGMYIMGENPAMSDPNLNHAREALALLDHLVVQDIFFTETAGFADVILPASAFPEKTGTFTNTDRRVQLGRQAIDPPGDARQDLWIIQEIARRIGLDWNDEGPEEVFEEIRKAVPTMAGMTWDRLTQVDSLTYPLIKEGDPGDPVIFTDGFPTEDGRGHFVPADYIEANEWPDEDYPFVFITGRHLEHWHTGSMTRRATVLDALEPEPVISIHPEDLNQIGALPGDMIRIDSRRGQHRGTRSIRYRHAAQFGVHGLLLQRGRRQPPDHRGPRPLRQDPGVQVLRRARRPRRRCRRRTARCRSRRWGDSRPERHRDERSGIRGSWPTLRLRCASLTNTIGVRRQK